MSKGPDNSETPSARAGEANEPERASFWQALAQGFLNTAAATGQGIQWIYEAGDENKHYIVPAINGIVGHKLEEMGDARAIQMSFRQDGKDVGLDTILQELPAGQSDIIVFVHGLMADEVPWLTAMPGKTGYGPELAKSPARHCLYVRYNTGRHISQNGQDLAELLEGLRKKGKGQIRRLILVGHSMGGLVVRSAGYYGRKRHHGWTKKLGDVVLIGVPNDGSFLERFGHIATFVLKNIWNYPTRIVGHIADERSHGIKDLRWGFMTEDWKDEDADKLMNVKRTEVPPLPGVGYHLLLGSVSESVISPLAMYFGDGLVGTRSAAGKEFVEFKEAATRRPGLLERIRGTSAPASVEYRAFMTTGHLGLLGSPEICEYLKEIL
ncbi:MAG: alpha/beta fold hydrolase [Leptospiraceae bacterium]|nr:alpha/beta fold hydrolase [Leptospiraceae bacterium]